MTDEARAPEQTLPPSIERRIAIAERMRHDNEWAFSYWKDVRVLERRLVEREAAAVAAPALDLAKLASLIIEYRFDQHPESEEWGAWESLWDRLASIHGRPGDSSRREAGAMLRHLIALSQPSPDEPTR